MKSEALRRRERPLGRSRVVFLFAGSMTGNTVVAAKKLTGLAAACGRKTEALCKRSVSAAGRTCARISRRKGMALDELASRAVPATTRVRPAVTRPLPGQGARAPSEAGPPSVHAELGAERGAGPTATAVRRTLRKPMHPAHGRAPRGGEVNVAAPVITQVTPEDVSTATFAGAAQKLFFQKALRDLSHADAATRRQTVKAMRGIPHELTVRALGSQLFRDASAAVRKECVNALAALEMGSGYPLVSRALDDVDGAVRLAAVRAIYRLGGAQSAGGLIQMLSDEQEEVRRMAVACIGWLGDENLAAEAASLLGDESAAVRRAAVEAIGNLGARELASAVAIRLTDKDDSVRRKAFRVIEEITGKAMSDEYPEDEEARQRLVARWRHWCREAAEP